MYKLIVTDLDGTLLNKDKKISEYNLSCIKKAMDKGVKFAVATGRIYGTALLAIEGLEYEGFIATSNGSVVTNINTGEIINSVPLDRETAFRAIDICRERDLYFHMYTETAIYSEKYESFVKKFTEELKEKENNELLIGVVNDAKLIFDKEVVNKLAIVTSDRSELDSAIEAIKAGGDINAYMSLSTSCDIMGVDVSKATGIEVLCEHYGISKDEVIALGDNENDLAMIEYAGMGIAMGNALDSVKEVANYITETNEEDGFGKAIEKFILNGGN